MRVGIDFRPAIAAPQSGIGRQVLAMAAALEQMPGVTLSRFSLHPSEGTTDVLVGPPGTVSAATFHRPDRRLKFEWSYLPRALSDARIEIYIATANSGLPLRAVRTPVRQAVLVHDLFQLTLPSAHRARWKAAVYAAYDRYVIGHGLRRADRIWTPSRYSGCEVEKYFPSAAGKLRVLPNQVSPLPPANGAGLQLPARYWLAVGTREPRKNIERLITAWKRARVDAALPDLVLIGAASDVPSELSSLDGIHWLQGVEEAQLAWIYKNAERLWHPSSAEGFGLPVVEAAAVGTDGVVARGSALDEITPADSLRFDPLSVDAIEHCMRTLANATFVDEARRQKLRAHAEGYGAAAYQIRLRELLEDLRA